MHTSPNSLAKRLKSAVKASCQKLLSPMLPILPSAVANSLPFLGQVCISAPAGKRLLFRTHGAHGKDRIAIKLARRGFWSYEGETTRVLLELLPAVRTFIDIGANTGLYAILAGKLFPSCKVWAFEPVPFIHDMLRENVLLNRIGNVETIAEGVTDFVGSIPFYITRTDGGIPTDSSSCQGFRADVEELRLPTTTLDHFMRTRAITQLDLVKIDTEAAEHKVIRGGQETLRTHRPFIVCEVLENVDHGYIQESMRSLGYLFFHINGNHLDQHDRLHGCLNVNQRNYLFVPSEKRAMIQSLRVPVQAAA